MKQTKKSIIEACHGKIMEKADYALEQYWQISMI